MYRKLAIGVTAALALTAAAAPAHAETQSDTYPQTPALNPQLPIIHTAHGSDHLKANILNPHPVCNANEDRRTVVYRVADHFLPVGTISTTNLTDKSIPLTQETSKQQSISLSVNGSQTSSVSGNIGGGGSGPVGSGTGNTTAGIAFSLARTIGGNASYSLQWAAGQTVGPYDVPAGHTGEATYGFRAITMSGTQQVCLPNGTWGTPTAWTAFAPLKNEVRVKIYDNPAGAIGGVGDDQTPKVPASETPVGHVTPEPTTPAPAPTTPVAHDLAVSYTVAAGKAPGYAGLVGIHVKNVGTQRYYADFPAVSFRVRVKTAKGPQGVDRLITPGYFNGAYTRDLGFDEATSTRTFEVTLSNPVNPGEDQLVANLNFGDGATREGRIVNSIEVSQVGRLADDKPTTNDQDVSSTVATRTDGGHANPGLF